MSSFAILDLVIGMIFIYFLLSIICSSAVELWLTMMRTRAKLLESWLKSIFNSPALDSKGQALLDEHGKRKSVGQAIMDHCMVTVLSDKGKSPSYISSQNFFSALIDQVTLTPTETAEPNAPVQIPPKTLAGYITAIQNSNALSGELKRTILILANEAEQAASVINTIPAAANITNNITTAVKSELDHFREKVEHWYDSSADRLTGKLKRAKVMPATIIAATIITIALNADSVSIGGYLYDHKAEAKQFADKAISSLENYKERIDKINQEPDTAKNSDSNAVAKLNSNLAQVKNDIATITALVPQELPFGWKNRTIHFENIIGWVVTILAICIGAPFWFDLLNKIANVRGSGPKPGSGKEDVVKK